MTEIALVTGGNRGIGYEICRGLAKHGIKVILTARKAVDAEEAAGKISHEGLDVIPYSLDVTDQRMIADARNYVEDRFQKLDILVNNAGVYLDRRVSLIDLSLDDLRQTYEVNVVGPLLMMQTFIPIMREGGRIVNLSSRMGSLANMSGGAPAYRSSKAALNALTRVAAAENPLLRINAMHPGWVNTGMGGDGAPLSPEEGADTAIWLAKLPTDGPTGGFYYERREIDW